jgi:hypothetical protein
MQNALTQPTFMNMLLLRFLKSHSSFRRLEQALNLDALADCQRHVHVSSPGQIDGSALELGCLGIAV